MDEEKTKSIKLSFSKKTGEIIERQADDLGVKPTSYCHDIVINKVMEREDAK